MLPVQLLFVTGGTVPEDASALLPEWQSGSLPLVRLLDRLRQAVSTLLHEPSPAPLPAATRAWPSVRLRELMLVRFEPVLPRRTYSVAATLLHEPQPAPLPLVRLRAWLLVPPEALL